MGKLRALLAAQKSDLAFFALLQVPLLALNILTAKVMAARHAYPDSPAGPFFGLVARVMPWDVLLLALVTAVILLSRLVTAPRALRGVLLALLYLLFAGLTLFHFVNAGFFMFFGAPLTRDLLSLAPPMMGYVTKVVTPDDPMLRLTLFAIVVPILLTPIAWQLRPRMVDEQGRWRRAALGLGVLLFVVAGGSLLTPVARYREIALRRLSVLSVIAPARGNLRRTDNTVTDAQRRTLTGILGDPQDQGRAAFAPLGRRKQNVVLWVWESVGERFLRAHHPFGEAEAPVLERLKEKGAVRFTQAYVECPLSAQSDWSFMTAVSAPSNPGVFKTPGTALPRHGPYLPALFREAGYKTAFLSSSYLESWGEFRFLRAAGLDLLEDGHTLENRAGYQYQRWSIEGRAIVDRFFGWKDAQAGDAPFFAVLWNVETHHNYEWIGMPPELAGDPPLKKYLAAINYTDKLLGDFYARLEERGLADDTIIVVVGDHGQGFGRGEQPHDRFHSLLVNEDTLHIPLVVLHPGLGRTTNVDTTVTLTDIYPSLLDLVGVAPPASVDGRSFAAPYQPRVLVHRAITWWPLAARAGRFKLVQDRRDDPPELYDVVADPWEAHDLSAQHPEITEALWAELRATTAQRMAEDPSFSLFSASDWFVF